MTEPGIHPSAPPNDLPADRLRLRPDASGDVAVDPADAARTARVLDAALLSAAERRVVQLS